MSSAICPASIPATWIEALEARRLFSGVGPHDYVMVIEPLPPPAGTLSFGLIGDGGITESSPSRFSVEPGTQQYAFPKQMVIWGTPANRPPVPPPDEVLPPEVLDKRPDLWTVDWGDGTRGVTSVGMSDGGLTIGEPHAYPEPGEYTITLTPPPSTPGDSYTVIAKVYRRGAGFEVIEMPAIVAHADKYDANPLNTIRLMRFRVDDNAGDVYDYHAHIHVNYQWYHRTSVVPIDGAPGTFDVILEGDFAVEGDFEVQIDVTRGTGHRRRVGDTVYSSWDESVASVRRRVVVSGRYEPVFAADQTPRASELAPDTTDDATDIGTIYVARRNDSLLFSDSTATTSETTRSNVMLNLEGDDDDGDLLAARGAG